MERQEETVEELTKLLTGLKIEQQHINRNIERLERIISKIQAVTLRKIQEGDRVSINNPKNGQETEGIVTGRKNTVLIRIKKEHGIVIRAKKNLTRK